MTAPRPIPAHVGFHGVEPTALTGYREIAAYSGQRVIVVGCGRLHDPHDIVNWGPGGAVRNIAGATAFTFDVDGTMSPHRIGDFWVADHTEDLPGGGFDLIYLENLPAFVFNSSGRCLGLARTAHRLLAAGGVLVVRTGGGLLAAGSPVHTALQQVFNTALGVNNVTLAVDQWGMGTHFLAQR